MTIQSDSKGAPDGKERQNDKSFFGESARFAASLSVRAEGEFFMEGNRIAQIGIIIEDAEATARVNEILHEFAGAVIGRMGLPYRERGIAVISIVADAPEPVINALAGKLGSVRGISARTLYAKV